MIPKKLILLAVFFVGGILLIFLGANNLLDARRLAAQGKRVAAEVVDRRVQRLYKDHNSHHDSVAFQAGSNQRVTNEVMVTKEVFDQKYNDKALDLLAAEVQKQPGKHPTA